ncbi:SNF2 family N-terminal domain-containing protein [Mycena filopes]|nr:SNF2 family N-terminal domain-containing protein [Mycena filopes]
MAKKELVVIPIPAVDVEKMRHNIAFTQLQISRSEAVHDAVPREKVKSKTKILPMAPHATELQRLRKGKATCHGSFPRASLPLKRTGSKPRLGRRSHCPTFPPFTALQQKPMRSSSRSKLQCSKLPSSPPCFQSVDQQNAVASSSKALGARALPDIASDDEMEVDPVIALNRYLHAIPSIGPLAGADHNDADVDYPGRGRDTFLGRQAKADSIDKFLTEAGNSEFFDGNESIEKALERLGLQSAHELLPSLDIPLMPHHSFASRGWWTTSRRTDEMGLGKTVQMIATMCKNPSDDATCKTTLIVAPLALMTQWNQEISTKTNANWKVLIYHGSNRPKKKGDLLKYDVVLTTYATMASEWLDFEAEETNNQKANKVSDDFIVSDSDGSGSERPKDKSKKQKGLLFQVDFYRVVLDEAHNIRNKRTRASRAVTELSSIYRWCLTATPIVNSLIDAYGYIRFLRIRPWCDWVEFNGHIGRFEKKRPDLAVTRLQAIFQHFLIRRMKTTELDGKRLIELPKKTVELVETMQQAKFNKYLKAGTVLKNYASVLVMLLRLRQLCSHPALIQENGTHFLVPDEANEPEEYRDEIARARAIMPADFVEAIQAKLKDVTLRRMEAEKKDAAADVDDCPICFDVLTAAVITMCGHQFCKDCLNEVFETPLPEQGGNANGYICKASERPCPACRTPISIEQVFPSAAFQPTENDLQDDADSDIQMLDITPANPTAKDKGKRKSQAKRLGPTRKGAANTLIALHSSDVEIDVDNDGSENEVKDSDMSDSESDKEGEDKDACWVVNKRLGKRRAVNTIADSDDENVAGTAQEKEVLFSAPKKKLTKEEAKLISRFLPSTKMKRSTPTRRRFDGSATWAFENWSNLDMGHCRMYRASGIYKTDGNFYVVIHRVLHKQTLRLTLRDCRNRANGISGLAACAPEPLLPLARMLTSDIRRAYYGGVKLVPDYRAPQGARLTFMRRNPDSAPSGADVPVPAHAPTEGRLILLEKDPAVSGKAAMPSLAPRAPVVTDEWRRALGPGTASKGSQSLVSQFETVGVESGIDQWGPSGRRIQGVRAAVGRRSGRTMLRIQSVVARLARGLRASEGAALGAGTAGKRNTRGPARIDAEHLDDIYHRAIGLRSHGGRPGVAWPHGNDRAKVVQSAHQIDLLRDPPRIEVVALQERFCTIQREQEDPHKSSSSTSNAGRKRLDDIFRILSGPARTLLVP